MNAVSSAQSASWQQYVPALNRENVGKCLRDMTASLAYPSTYGKVAIVACVLFSLIPAAEASCREDCFNSLNSCNDFTANLMGLALFDPAHFLFGNSCGDRLKACLRYC